MHYDILAQLLDSHTRSKLLKLFYRNQKRQYDLKEIASKTQSALTKVRAELKRFIEIKIIRSSKKRGRLYYFLNRKFRYHSTMEKFVFEMGVTPIDQLTRLVKNLGNVKLAYASGIFIKKENSKIDLFIVGEDISNAKFNNLLKRLEAEAGKEIDYTVIDTDEYQYRKGMFDRFILELEEKPHEVLVDKLSAGKRFN